MPKIVSKRHRLANPPPEPIDDSEEWISSGVVTNGAPIPPEEDPDEEVLRRTTRDVDVDDYFDLGDFDLTEIE